MNAAGTVARLGVWQNARSVTLTEIEGKRDEAAKALQGLLKGLRYV